ncbi:MAG TPA: TonB-dependent receptor plug domain-containing protein, partial [Allosphingosinicella sp.]|nr:TonB-dependent receptor plug domain-containing protein [Allosphingosinicella sp.]
MRKFGLLGSSAICTAAFGFAFAAPAYAQTTTSAAQAPATGVQSPECPDQNNDGVCDDESTLTNADTTAQQPGTIVVTGSRIRRDTFSTLEPITVITSQEITQSGFNSATDALQSTGVTAGAGQINNFFGGFVTAGGTGANTLGLRGLGPARTLILLNGRRIAPAGTRGNVLAADLNVLPTAIVERIEILKAGASSVYGSDAVAGVVNIITDEKLRGFTVDAQVNVPEVGAGVDRRISGSFGFGNDRANIVGSVEYRKRDALRLNDRDFTSCPIGGALSGPGTAFGSGDTPNFFGSTCFTIDNGGTTFNTLGVPNRLANARGGGAVGTFNRLIPTPGTGGPTPGFQGVTLYTRDTFDPRTQEEEIVTPAEIYTGFISGTYDLGFLGNSELYAE